MNKKNRYISKLKKSNFFRSVFTVAFGTGMAQLINMLFSIFLTRIYGPEAYGVHGTFSSTLMIFVPIAALTFPTAIVLPKDDKDAYSLVKLSLHIGVIVIVLVTLILVLFYSKIIEIFNLETIEKFIILLPIGMFVTLILQIAQQWLIRKKLFNRKSKIIVLYTLLINILMVCIGIIFPTPKTLIVLYIIGYGVHALLIIISIIKDNSISINKMFELFKFDIEENKKLFERFKDFPKFRAPQEFINAISVSLPVILLTSFFGPASAGFYSLGKKVLEMPTQLLGNSVADVFFPRIAEAAINNEDSHHILKKATMTLVYWGIIPFMLISILAPQIFGLVFGEEWIKAGIYARWIGIWSFTSLISRPSVKALPVIGAQKFHLYFTLGNIVVRFISLYFGAFILNNDIYAIILYSASGAIMNIALIFITHKLTKL